ncbi:hypothetical protein KEM54_004675, partial [Ascosphaera aggregata]
ENLEASWISPEHFEEPEGKHVTDACSVNIGDPREIGKGSNAPKTEIREVQLRFPGGDTSNFFTLNDCIIEYRDNIGIMTAKDGQGGSKFTSGYGITYVSFGIREVVADWIRQMISTQLRGTDVSFGEVGHHKGYIWLYAKIPNADNKPKVATYYGTRRDGMKTMDFLRALKKVQRNIFVDAALSIRLTQGERESLQRRGTHKVSITISTLLVGTATDIGSPPIATEFRSNFSGETSEALMNLFRDMKIKDKE